MRKLTREKSALNHITLQAIFPDGVPKHKFTDRLRHPKRNTIKVMSIGEQRAFRFWQHLGEDLRYVTNKKFHTAIEQDLDPDNLKKNPLYMDALDKLHKHFSDNTTIIENIKTKEASENAAKTSYIKIKQLNDDIIDGKMSIEDAITEMNAFNKKLES